MNAAKRGIERRKWIRLPLAIPVFVRSRDEKGKEFLEFATALNVSAGGMLVAVRRILPAFALNQIHLEIPSAPVAALALASQASRNHGSRNEVSRNQVSRNLRAKAVRTIPEDGYYLLGLKFSRPLLRAADSNGLRRRRLAPAQ